VSLGKFPVAKALEDSERGIGIQGGEGRVRGKVYPNECGCVSFKFK